MTLSGPASVTGSLSHPWWPDTSTIQHACEYGVRANATGSGEARWTGARWEITPPPGSSATYHFTGDVPGSAVASWFRSSSLSAGGTGEVVLETSVTFAAGPEPRGAVGAHHARWTFRYQGPHGADSARYEVECLPAAYELFMKVSDARTGHGVPGVTLTIDGRTFQTTDGFFRVPSFVAGIYRASLRSPRHTSLDTTIFVDHREHYFELVRLAPYLERFDFACGPSLCPATVDWYDPAGSAALPADATASASGDPKIAPWSQSLTDSSDVILDAGRRRYVFPGVRNDAVRFELPLTDARGYSARFVCQRQDYASPNWGCAEVP